MPLSKQVPSANSVHVDRNMWAVQAESNCIYSEFHNYLDTVGGVFNPDYTDTSDFAGGLRRFLSHKAALLQCLLEKRLLIFRIHYSSFALQESTSSLCAKNLFEKEKPTQKLMFMLNHWSSKILT